MLALHDFDNGTGFTANWPACGSDHAPPSTCAAPVQNTRLGKESVICQKCHADNVIAVVKSAYKDAGLTQLIKPITEAIHHRHREVARAAASTSPITPVAAAAVRVVIRRTVPTA